MSEDGFLEKLKEYLTNRYNKKEIIEKRLTPPHYTIKKYPPFKSIEGIELRWHIGASGKYPKVEEDSKNRVFVWSPSIGDFYDVFPNKLELMKFFRKWCRRYHRHETFDEEVEFRKMMVDEERWREIEEDEDFKWMIKSFRKDKEIARKVSEKTGFKIIYHISSFWKGDEFYFFTSFDSTGMSSEEKMKTIERAIDAVEEAYGLWRTW